MKYLRSVSTLKLYVDKCTGCGVCIEVCPHSVFEMNNKRSTIKDLDLCMECGACALNCAFGALSVNAGVGCAAALINGKLTGDVSCGCGGPENTCC